MSDKLPSSSASLLIELGTEELPPKALKVLAESFSRSISQFLTEAGVASDQHGAVQFFAAPRRLAVLIKDVESSQQDRVEQRRGPAVSAAFKDGEPTKAALGFARSCGAEIDQLGREATDKGEWLSYEIQVTGMPLSGLVNTALEQAVKQLPIPKRMRWGDSDQEFVRPVHWLLAMHGLETLEVSVLGLSSSNKTRGHRFLASGEITVPSADDYVSTLLEKGKVQVDYAARQTEIRTQVESLAQNEKAQAVIHPALLDEVTGLVEWPVAIYGQFDSKFLEVPTEVLVSSMSDHQKYFHLVDEKGQLLPGFITVSNIESNEVSRVRAGNERVLRARLSDAEFFWQGDQKTKLDDRIPALERVLFHKKLGSVHDKVSRIKALAKNIAQQIGADSQLVERACDLCKTDLVTDMVSEFPELQGTVGRYYAANQGEDEIVAKAIEAHYQPRFAGDDLPQDAVSQCLALADRLDSLAGIFACGEVPSGDKDPFGLRRASLGVLRILIESDLNLDLYKLVNQAVDGFSEMDLSNEDDVAKKISGFVVERLRAYYQPLGFDTEEINAVMAVQPSRPLDFDRRLRALHDFVENQSSAALSLAAANKRIANILVKQKSQLAEEVKPSLFKESAETALFDLVDQSASGAQQAFADGKYSEGLVELSALKSPVDTFFDEVMVMDEDLAVRANRLALLQSIRALFLNVADISLIRVE